jgi:glycosyltransferase involved in cell wall biosynthesis
MNKVFFLVASNSESIIRFRGDLIDSLIDSNRKVVALSPNIKNSSNSFFMSRGVSCEFIPIRNSSFNIFHDIRTFLTLIKLYKKYKVSEIMAYTIKPVLWCGLSSRFLNINYYALITGLGYSFYGDSLKRRVLTKLVIFLYKAALKNSTYVFFQNKDNQDVFLKMGIIPRSKACIVNGSGVNIKEFDIVELPKKGFRFLCISRLLGEKGLREYAAAARIVKNKFPNVEFDLVGSEDLSPDAIPLSEVRNWSDYISYKGSTSDVRPYIKNSHVYVLPSYHEGLPRSTLEAMSMGRPILTTDTIGCKDTVENGVNGFKVQVKSVDELSKKMIWFIEHSDHINKMGLESRKMVEDKFDVHKVNKEMLKIMDIK